jgi:adenylate cyclase
MKFPRSIGGGFSVIRQYRIKMILSIAISWTVIDMFFFIFRILTSPPSKTALFPNKTIDTILLREVNVFFISLCMGYALVFLLRNLLRNASVFTNILLKTLILIIAALAVNFLIHTTYVVLIDKKSFATAVNSFYTHTFQGKWLLEKMPEWFILFILTQIIIEFIEKYSPGIFFAIFFGKYLKPKNEFLIIMFIDLKNSTPIAEKMDNASYFRFIREFIYHISTALLELGGRIYQYVGDEIIVSWPAKQKNYKNCIQALISARKNIEKNGDRFRRAYGFLPEFKVGIHYGEVTIGEIGVIKKDLAMSGDAMNTTARIRDACSELNQKFIVSKEFLEKSNLTDWQTETLGGYELKGKNTSIELFALKI